jgi:phenylacetate-coenzyme A ligase PaaK-like adenylate-forming protein
VSASPESFESRKQNEENSIAGSVGKLGELSKQDVVKRIANTGSNALHFSLICLTLYFGKVLNKVEKISWFKENLHKVNAKNFESIALSLFKIQAEQNLVYKSYLKELKISVSSIKKLESIPFLPISFFKSNAIKTGKWEPQTVFSSSGTTGAVTSQHFVKDLSFYLNHAETIYNSFYGNLDKYHFLALLPSYVERGGSSLVAMADYFIKKTESPYSGFYLNNYSDLADTINHLRNDSRKIILLGVTFALLEMAESSPIDLSNCIVMETGGMKGRRKEIIRQELHSILKGRLNIKKVASEYGMTELFSQAYSDSDGYYRTPPNMKILIRNVYDPNQLELTDRIGIIKIIDLANVDTCAFIETQDLGRLSKNGSFEVLGRLDNSDSRGCNLMM